METKSIALGAIGTIMILLTIGGAMAAFIGSGETIEVPSGYTMVYFLMPNADALELRDAAVWAYNYQDEIYDWETDSMIPNPQSKAEFADNKVKQYGLELIMAYRRHLAEQAINLGTPPEMID